MHTDQLPVVIGVGQYSHRPEDLARAPHPLEMMAIAARAAADDAGAPRALAEIDTLVVVNALSWSYADPPAELASLLGAHPRRQTYSGIGGNTPQYQVNEIADLIAGGEIRLALIAGAEAMYSLRRAQKSGTRLPWPPKPANPPVDPEGRWGNTSIEMSHRAQMPTQMYPLFENAIRKARGRTPEQQRDFLGRFCARFAAVAAENPYAWFPQARSAAEIATPSADNRMIGFPYPKYMNAIMEVDQSAALLLADVATARRLGVPPEKWVYVWGSGDATDIWYVSERPELHASPAIRAAGAHALEQAGIGIGDVDFFDLYSCFPCAPQIGAAMLGIAEDDPRPLTVTGGLPYAGGPGNNYVTHSIATMVEKLRANADRKGLVSGVGWYMTKHAVGIYGGEPPAAPRRRTAPKVYQAEIDAASAVKVAESPSGAATIETYTVLHDREGAPETGLVVGRLDDGSRFWANTPPDRGLLEEMERREFIGQRGRVRHEDSGLNLFEV